MYDDFSELGTPRRHGGQPRELPPSRSQPDARQRFRRMPRYASPMIYDASPVMVERQPVQPVPCGCHGGMEMSAFKVVALSVLSGVIVALVTRGK